MSNLINVNSAKSTFMYNPPQGLTVELDYVSGSSPIYIGYAIPGSSTASALWAIRKLTYDSSNNLVIIQWSGGSLSFNQIWDNRASLSYS